MHPKDILNEELTVQDVVRLVELVDKVQKKGHYASVQFSNYGSNVEVYFMRNGFRIGARYDFHEDFCLTDKSCDIDAYHKIVLFFMDITEGTKEMTIEEIEKELGYKICIVSEKEED